MVKFSPALLVITTLALSVFASPLGRRDVNKVKTDLELVARDITALDAIVAGLAAPLSVEHALALQATVKATGNAIDQTTRDVKDVNIVSESDARVILGLVNTFIPNIVKVLRDIDGKKAVLFSLNFPGAGDLIRVALRGMHDHSTALSDALIAAAPADDKNQAMGMKNTVEVEFEKLLNDFDN